MKPCLGGLHTNICIRHTAAEAFFRGYNIIIAEDESESFAQKDHKEGLEYLEYVYNAQVKPVSEIIKSL